MDRISKLHDDLLLRILSLFPTTNDVVSTMVLSKRWQFLWTLVPNLVYDDRYQNIDYRRFVWFVPMSLILHKAPVIENLHFKLSKIWNTEDIHLWIEAADKRFVRELIIEIETPTKRIPQVTLPKSLYTWCRTLVTLKLRNAKFPNDVSSPISFPLLKVLSLISMTFPGDEFVERLLSSCPVLEDFVLEQDRDDNLPIVSVRVPSLKRLVLNRFDGTEEYDPEEFVVDAPSLECLDIFCSLGSCVFEKTMTKISKAGFVVNDWHPEKNSLASLLSAKRLYLCIPASKDAYPDGSIFSSLVHLTICTCETEWVDLLIRILRDSPNIKVLKLGLWHDFRDYQPRPSWNEKNMVPEYLLSSLETFEWIDYEGTEMEKKVLAFILRIATCLKQATIFFSEPIIDHKKRLEMLNEFPVSSRSSPSCLLTFY